MATRYDIDYKRLALMLLPIVLRKPLLAAYTWLGLSPIQSLARAFDNFRTTTDYRLQHNGQVCRLRALLNDIFDPTLRRIEVCDVASVGPLFLYHRSQNHSLTAYYRSMGKSILVGRRGYQGAEGFDFAVVVPLALRADSFYNEARLRALVNTYKLASKRFTISYQ